MIFQAHRGVSSHYPENTMPAFIAAVKEGYKIIEIDLEVTQDLKVVLQHDNTINRTGRHSNGDLMTNEIKVCDITYNEALKYDFGIWFSQEFKGTKIPLFEDILKFARENEVKLKIDNKHEKFTTEQKNALYKLISTYQDVACLTYRSIDEIERAVKIFPQMHFHYDGPVTAENMERLGDIIPKERLTVWLPHENSNTYWVKVEFANKELSELVKKHANLGVWILTTTEQFNDAVSLGADVIETNGQLKPYTINDLNI